MYRTLRVLVLTLPATAAIAAQSGPSPAPLATPEAKAVHEVAHALGMLRGLQLREVILTMHYEGSGTQTVVAPATRGAEAAQPQSFTVTNYTAKLAYDFPGMRVELERVPTGAAAGQPEKQIFVVSGKYAWNESEPGAGLLPGLGTATPMAAAWAERYLEMWMLPHSFVKAAMQSTGTRVAMEGGAQVITTNVPNMPGATMKAWLNDKKLIDRVESRPPGAAATATIDVRYSAYKDIGGEINPSDVMFPGRIVKSVGGRTALDITVTGGNTYNPYVIMPVPESVASTAVPAGAAATPPEQRPAR